MGRYLDLAKAVKTAERCGNLASGVPEPRPIRFPGTAENQSDWRYERNELYEKRSAAICPPGGRAVLLQVPDRVPEAWAQGVADLLAMPVQRGWPEPRWKTLREDALGFLRDWAGQAHALGWSAQDLFGVDAAAPRARLDAMGLVPMLGGRPVVAITEGSVVIAGESGATLTYRRRKIWPTGCCRIWELKGPL